MSNNKKILLRKKMKIIRNNLSKNDQAKKSDLILNNLFSLVELEKAQTVFTYLSFGSEVSTKKLIIKLLKRNITVCVPKIINKDIQPIIIKDFMNLAENKFGYLEPINDHLIAKRVNLCITPGLAFTKSGKRLGYGGGYYDRFFYSHPEVLKVTLAYKAQVLDILPTTSQDQQIDFIITEKEAIKCSYYQKRPQRRAFKLQKL